MPVSILSEGGGLLVVDKPAGMLVHRGWGQDDVVMVDRVRAAGWPSAVPIHRLDRQTSGVLLFAVEPAVVPAFSELFEQGRVHKEYLTLVRGRLLGAGEVDHPLPRRENGPRVYAFSRYQGLACAATEPQAVSLVRVEPQTGRPHQVRRHMKHRGHPVIGDANWGKGPLNRAFRARYGLCRLALHAARLSMVHPVTGERVTFEAPLPEDLLGPLARMGFSTKWLPKAHHEPPPEPIG